MKNNQEKSLLRNQLTKAAANLAIKTTDTTDGVCLFIFFNETKYPEILLKNRDN